jgi:uncharacterized protein
VSIKNCKRCGKVYRDNVSSKICLKCKENREEIYEKIKEYVQRNRGATIVQISQELGTSVRTIIESIDEGIIERID